MTQLVCLHIITDNILVVNNINLIKLVMTNYNKIYDY